MPNEVKAAFVGAAALVIGSAIVAFAIAFTATRLAREQLEENARLAYSQQMASHFSDYLRAVDANPHSSIILEMYAYLLSMMQADYDVYTVGWVGGSVRTICYDPVQHRRSAAQP